MNAAKSEALISSGRSVRSRRATVNPAPASARKWRSPGAGGSGSGRRIRLTPSAEASSPIACTPRVTVLPSSCTIAPPSIGPSEVSSQNVDSSFPSASVRRSLGTRFFRCAAEAPPKTIPPSAPTAETATSCQNVRTPSRAATGTERYSSARTTSAAIITGRFRRASRNGPIGSASAAPTRPATAVSRETWKVVASSVRTAISARAPMAIAVPASDAARANHSRWKSRSSGGAVPDAASVVSVVPVVIRAPPLAPKGRC